MNENIPLVMLLSFAGILSGLLLLLLRGMEHQKRSEDEELRRKSQP